MNSPEQDRADISQESLTYVKPLKDLWVDHRGNFFDAVVGSKDGVWVDCPNFHEIYLKTLHLDRHGEIIRRSYRRINASRLVIRLDESSVRDIEYYGFSNINHALELSEVTAGKVSIEIETQSIRTISLPIDIFNEDPEQLSRQLFGRRSASKESAFVFSDRKVGEQSEYIKNSFEEVYFKIKFENLKVSKNDGEIISGRSGPKYDAHKEILSKIWVRKSLEVLNKVAYKYNYYNKEDKEKNQVRDSIEKELREELSIKNKQKLNSAIYIVSGSWSSYKKGIFGKPEDGKINLLEAINRLAEIDFDAEENDFPREIYVGGRSDETRNDFFKDRRKDSVTFKHWVKSELGLYKNTGWEALYKHIGEFIKK